MVRIYIMYCYIALDLLSLYFEYKNETLKSKLEVEGNEMSYNDIASAIKFLNSIVLIDTESISTYFKDVSEDYIGK